MKKLISLSLSLSLSRLSLSLLLLVAGCNHFKKKSSASLNQESQNRVPSATPTFSEKPPDWILNNKNSKIVVSNLVCDTLNSLEEMEACVKEKRILPANVNYEIENKTFNYIMDLPVKIEGVPMAKKSSTPNRKIATPLYVTVATAVIGMVSLTGCSIFSLVSIKDPRIRIKHGLPKYESIFESPQFWTCMGFAIPAGLTPVGIALRGRRYAALGRVAPDRADKETSIGIGIILASVFGGVGFEIGARNAIGGLVQLEETSNEAKPENFDKLYQAWTSEVLKGNVQIEAKNEKGEIVVADLEPVVSTGYHSEDTEMLPVLEKMQEGFCKGACYNSTKGLRAK